MAVINIDGIAYAGENGTLSDAIIEYVVRGMDLSTLGIRLRQDVTTKMSTIFASLGSKLMRRGAGCGASEDNATVTFRERWLDPEDVEIEADFCAKDFDKIIAGLGLKKGVDKKDLTGTEVDTLLRALFGDAWQHDFKSLALNGDKAVSPATAIGKFYYTIDGLFKQLIAGVALTGPDKIQRYTAITTTPAADYMRDTWLPGVWAKQPQEMKAVPAAQKVYVVTEALWENYYQTLSSNDQLESSFKTLQDGQEVLMYRGIQVVKEILIDEAITDLTITTKNRGYLTVKDNLEVACDTAEESAVLDLFYDKKSKENTVRINHTMATQYSDARFTVVGY